MTDTETPDGWEWSRALIGKINANQALIPKAPVDGVRDFPVTLDSRRAALTFPLSITTPNQAAWATKELERFTYKPGWKFEIVVPLVGEPNLVITVSTQDTYHPKRTIDICSRTPLYTMGIPHHDAFARALGFAIREFEIHESQEWLRRDGEIYDNPHNPRPRP